jgi:hypothetical protein
MTNHEAIYKLNPNVVTIRGDIAYDANDNIVEYNKSEVENYLNINRYKELRAKQYPQITNQLDMLWHAIDTNTLNKDSDFYKTLKQVKDNYPKPE